MITYVLGPAVVIAAILALFGQSRLWALVVLAFGITFSTALLLFSGMPTPSTFPELAGKRAVTWWFDRPRAIYILTDEPRTYQLQWDDRKAGAMHEAKKRRPGGSIRLDADGEIFLDDPPDIGPEKR